MKAKVPARVIQRVIDQRAGSPRVGWCRKYDKQVYSEHTGCAFFEFRALRLTAK